MEISKSILAVAGTLKNTPKSTYNAFSQVGDMEIAKFVLIAVGTFISVTGLFWSIWTYWKKKQEGNDKQFQKSVKESIDMEQTARLREHEKLEKRVDYLEGQVINEMQRRMSNIEGELKGFKPILQSIQNWFITNTPGRG